MANRAPAPDPPELRERWGSFAWTAENAGKAAEIASMPTGRYSMALVRVSLMYRGGRSEQSDSPASQFSTALSAAYVASECSTETSPYSADASAAPSGSAFN